MWCESALERFFVRALLLAYGTAIALGLVLAVSVTVLIRVFHIPGRVVADLVAALFSFP